MLSRIPVLLAALVLPVLATPGAAQDAPTACVWTLDGANGTTVYLAGSVHLLRAEDHPLPDIYQAAYEDSDRVYFEVDLAKMEAPEMQMKILQISTNPDGKTLADVLTAETWQRLDAYMKKNGMSGNPMLNRLTPGMIGITIAGMEAMKLGALPQHGVEKTFDGQARKDGKTVKALETVEFQIGLFNGFSQEEADRFIAMTLDDIEESPEKLGEMIDAWKKGDAESMDTMINDAFEKEDKLAKLLLYDRNANWIPAIEAELAREDGNTMFIVGAGHLVGEGSVIELLAKKGIKATQK